MTGKVSVQGRSDLLIPQTTSGECCGLAVKVLGPKCLRIKASSGVIG